MVSELWSRLSLIVINHVMCPSCPTQEAARDAFWSEGAALRVGGMIGPFVVTAGLLALVVSRLGGRERAGGELASKEEKP